MNVVIEDPQEIERRVMNVIHWRAYLFDGRHPASVRKYRKHRKRTEETFTLTKTGLLSAANEIAEMERKRCALICSYMQDGSPGDEALARCAAAINAAPDLIQFD